MNAKELEKLILKNGFVLLEGRGKGAHRVYRKQGMRDIVLPFHGSQEISKGVEHKIKKDLGLK